MKRIVPAFILLTMIAALSSGSVRSFSKPHEEQKRKCTGYTIIEAGKGLNCYGDTIQLSRINGSHYAN